MGKSITPTYRLVVTDASGTHVQSWSGRASQERLADYIQAYAKSLQIGGVNEHVSRALGYIPYPRRAIIVHQRSGNVVAEWRAAMFQAF